MRGTLVRLRGSSAWVIPCAFLVALAAVGAVVALQLRVSHSRDAQVALTQAERDFDALQSAPYDVIGQPPTGQALVILRMRARVRAVERSIADLRRRSSDPDLIAVAAPYRANTAVLRQISSLLVSGKQDQADRLGAVSGRLQRAVDRDLARAGAGYDRRASRASTIATAGSSAAILTLVSLFGLFYARSRRAQARARKLAAENASILMQDAQLQVIQRLALAGEYRDDDTGQHTRRVAELSEQIGSVLRMPCEQLLLLRQAAPLHDVGKIAIPDAILLKPGRLTPEEFERMKAHTALGAEMLAGGRELSLLAMAEEIARTHHERWDGSGYPASLAGAAIPLVGRIVAVADVFDALTHARPYKSAWTMGEAGDEIWHQRGRQFDPEVVDAFLQVLPKLAATGAGGTERRLTAVVA